MAEMCFSLVFVVLVALNMGSNLVEASPVDGEVMWSSSDLDLDKFEMPGPCADQSHCFEKGENYPEEKIEELLENMHNLKVENPEARTDIDSRNGLEKIDEDCLSDSSESPIYYIIDKNDKVRVVVQSPKKFQQIYSVKWCRDEGLITRDTPHFLKNSNILSNFKIQCVSTKMDFDFFVLSDEVDPKTNKPKMEIARAKEGIPVCCRCLYNVDD